MSYHVSEIPKGVYGEFSKIKEEFYEAQDAVAQGDNILLLNEICDLYGAIEEFVKRTYNMSMQDVEKFSKLTKSAFESGRRTSSDAVAVIDTKQWSAERYMSEINSNYGAEVLDLLRLPILSEQSPIESMAWIENVLVDMISGGKEFGSAWQAFKTVKEFFLDQQIERDKLIKKSEENVKTDQSLKQEKEIEYIFESIHEQYPERMKSIYGLKHFEGITQVDAGMIIREAVISVVKSGEKFADLNMFINKLFNICNNTDPIDFDFIEKFPDETELLSKYDELTGLVLKDFTLTVNVATDRLIGDFTKLKFIELIIKRIAKSIDDENQLPMSFNVANKLEQFAKAVNAIKKEEYTMKEIDSYIGYGVLYKQMLNDQRNFYINSFEKSK